MISCVPLKLWYTRGPRLAFSLYLCEVGIPRTGMETPEMYQSVNVQLSNGELRDLPGGFATIQASVCLEC